MISTKSEMFPYYFFQNCSTEKQHVPFLAKPNINLFYYIKANVKIQFYLSILLLTNIQLKILCLKFVSFYIFLNSFEISQWRSKRLNKKKMVY